MGKGPKSALKKLRFWYPYDSGTLYCPCNGSRCDFRQIKQRNIAIKGANLHRYSNCGLIPTRENRALSAGFPCHLSLAKAIAAIAICDFGVFRTRTRKKSHENCVESFMLPCIIYQGKTKGQQLKGKIVHNFHTFSHFSEFFPQDFPLQNKGF